jgi:hypothetical protein
MEDLQRHTLPPEQWSTAQVVAWVRGQSDAVAHFAGLFERNDVDGRTLLTMAEPDLAGIGVESFGARRQLALAIARLKGGPAAGAAAASSVGVGGGAGVPVPAAPLSLNRQARVKTALERSVRQGHALPPAPGRPPQAPVPRSQLPARFEALLDDEDDGHRQRAPAPPSAAAVRHRAASAAAALAKESPRARRRRLREEEEQQRGHRGSFDAASGGDESPGNVSPTSRRRAASVGLAAQAKTANPGERRRARFRNDRNDKALKIALESQRRAKEDQRKERHTERQSRSGRDGDEDGYVLHAQGAGYEI